MQITQKHPVRPTQKENSVHGIEIIIFYTTALKRVFHAINIILKGQIYITVRRVCSNSKSPAQYQLS